MNGMKHRMQIRVKIATALLAGLGLCGCHAAGPCGGQAVCRPYAPVCRPFAPVCHPYGQPRQPYRAVHGPYPTPHRPFTPPPALPQAGAQPARRQPAGREIPPSAREFFDHAVREHRGGNSQEARSLLQLAREIDPDFAEVYELEASIALDRGEREAHLQALRAALAAAPGSAEVQNRVGLRLFHAGEREQGLAALIKAVELAPNVPEYVRDLAAIHVEVGDLKVAREILTWATRHHPQEGSLAVALARVCESAEDWPAAARYFEAALSHDSDNPILLRGWARCLFLSSRYAAARDVFSALTQGDGSQLSLAEEIQYADAGMRTGDYQQAKTVLDELSSRSETRLKQVELLRGLCALRLGENDRAKAIFTGALTEWPGDAELKQAAALCDEAAKPSKPE